MSYIVPRDKPKRCTQPKCRFMDRNTLDCRLQGKSWESFEEQYEHCPLIEIHTPPAEPMVDIRDTQYNLPIGTDTISRAKAIEALKNRQDDGKGDISRFYNTIIQYDIEAIEQLPSAQPKIIRCKDCKHWIPYDWMFSEVWQSKNIADYPEDDIGCDCSEMAMKANDFCSRAERREVTK